ncbi:putative quinol monooxygenase [Aquiflexum sp.]|uniref:putative quinol monooxygenase n=1 Tax=Aquiflexum sp. TaxID=1872584 RepID=UPI003594706A
MKIINFETHREKIQKTKGLLLCLFFLISFGNVAYAQEKNQMVRLAIIKVDPLQLEAYQVALKKQMNAAILKEPGVLTYYAVADKSDPSKITILEIYADTADYQTHITTEHFLKYKETVKDMVTSLELVDVDLISSLNKTGN